MNWFAENWGTLLVIAVIAAAVVFAVIVMMKDKKQGKSACGNKCAHCSMAGKCHGASAQK